MRRVRRRSDPGDEDDDVMLRIGPWPHLSDDGWKERRTSVETVRTYVRMYVPGG